MLGPVLAVVFIQSVTRHFHQLKWFLNFEFTSRTLSNVLLRSMKQTYADVLNSIDLSFSCLIMNTASVVDLFRLKPCCSSLFDICVSSISFRIPVKRVCFLSLLEYRDSYTFEPFRRYFRCY